jgi:hypothetical protein
VLRRERPGGMDRLLMAMATGYDYRQYQKIRTQAKPVRDQASRRRETRTQWVNPTRLIAANGHLQTVH